jgi:hypothetical protein
MYPQATVLLTGNELEILFGRHQNSKVRSCSPSHIGDGPACTIPRGIVDKGTANILAPLPSKTQINRLGIHSPDHSLSHGLSPNDR